MKVLFFTLALQVLLISEGRALSTMEKINRSAGKDTVQVFMHFDQPPRYTSNLSGKRLDIVFESSQIAEPFEPLSEDEKIIKFLNKKTPETVALSFFFRYPPQRVSISVINQSTVVADILLGNRFTKTYQEFSDRLQGVTIVDRPQINFANPLISSSYAQDWYTFFSDYESPVKITAPVNFYRPHYPFSAKLSLPGVSGTSLVTDEIMTLAKQESWHLLLPKIKSRLHSGLSLDEQKILALMYGETLMRSDDFAGAYKQLYLLIDAYPQEQTGLYARYLYALLIAQNGNPHQAAYELSLLAEDLTSGHQLEPYVQISQAEMCLATGQTTKLKTILARDDIAYPEPLQKIKELRAADLLYLNGAEVRSYVTYTLLADEINLAEQPFSLNGLCAIYYDKHEYKQAAACYRQLSSQLDQPAALSLSYFRAAMARLNDQQDNRLIAEFERIEDTFPGTEGGFRAALKKTDIRFLQQSGWMDTALKYYHALAEKSIYRVVREEAFFKEALLYHLRGDNSTSIDLLMTLLRNFRSGDFLTNPQALLVQLLPQELARLVSEKSYQAALVLAQKNRYFFDNNWIDLRILSALAFSYHQLGIFDDAMSMYLYLIETANLEEKEQYFLKLAEIAYEKRDYHLVQDFFAQYSYNFPDGRYKLDLLYLNVKILDTMDKAAEALALLPAELPAQTRFVHLAAALYFKNNQYDEVVKIASRYPPAEQASWPADQLFFLAESFFKIGELDQAASFFAKVKDQQRFSGQSLFRLAEISHLQGRQAEALALYREIVAGNGDDLWKKYAQRALQLHSLTQ